MTNFPSFSKRPIAFALLLALLLTLGLAGIASASPVAPSDVVPCLTASPPNQFVVIGHAAKVSITVNCVPTSFQSFVDVAWGDQTTTRYIVCTDLCPIPPIEIDASHIYGSLGVFHPTICLVPSPTGAVPDCVQVEIQVVQLIPPS